MDFLLNSSQFSPLVISSFSQLDNFGISIARELVWIAGEYSGGWDVADFYIEVPDMRSDD